MATVSIRILWLTLSKYSYTKIKMERRRSPNGLKPLSKALYCVNHKGEEAVINGKSKNNQSDRDQT